MSIALIDEATDQMGVAVKLQGQEYWFSYLEQKVTDAEITDEERDALEKKYDGYEMIWTFTNPYVQPVDGNIDAACLAGNNQDFSTDYSDGGFCCGIKYVGSFSPQPEKWAVWATKDQIKDHAAATGFTKAIDDSANWSTNATSFTVSWDMSRWLPKQERDKEFYLNEYRFEAGDSVSAYTYVNLPDTKYSLTWKKEITLLTALSGVSNAAMALTLSLGLLAF